MTIGLQTEKKLNAIFSKMREANKAYEFTRGQWYRVRFKRVNHEVLQFKLTCGRNVETMDEFDITLKTQGFKFVDTLERGKTFGQTYTKGGRTYEFLQRML